MPPSECKRHVFVIRIWCEARELTDASPIWRGMIEYVQNGERRYLKHLDEIALFIAPYLVENMGVQTGLRWRLKQWFSGRNKTILTEQDERYEKS